ncbi:UDP-N-acetylmuramate dehydrogenase [Candidatus Peregrinibacteria bacterium]|nr:UDP-N-acetylmuramate dehydrogenase [Candidatus Peregrinibacteria bacterium]
MNDDSIAKKRFIKRFPQTQSDKDLAPLTAYGIGGAADLYIQAHHMLDIPEIIQQAHELHIPYYLLGGGRNIVFSDKGFRGLIIHNKAMSIAVRENKITAESGAMLAQVLAEARKHKLGGIMKMVGLPGTIGGALYGNAGAQGVEIGDFVTKATLFDYQNGVHTENSDYFQFSYRTSILKKTHETVLSVTLTLPPLDPHDVTPEIITFRAKKQPKGKVAGSFFKNPSPDKPAGMLIDKAGLKGLRRGDITVSLMHGNWLINEGNGTQKELIELAKHIKETVHHMFDVTLQPENILLDERGNKIDI